jgi:hypothetical protein
VPHRGAAWRETRRRRPKSANTRQHERITVDGPCGIRLNADVDIG